MYEEYEESYSTSILEHIVRVPSYIVNSNDEIAQVYNNFRVAGYEGVIVEKIDGNYERKRSYGWMKIKPKDNADLTIIGGFTDLQRTEYWEMFQRDAERIDDVEDMELIGLLAEVSYHEVSPDGSLRHPVFAGLRGDKLEASF